MVYAFVDLSYYVFHRYYAIQRWCKLSKTEFASLEEMLARFEKLFEDNLVALKKLYGFAWHRLVLAKDCSRDRIWRMEHYASYKKSRDKPDDFDPAVFVHTYNVVLPKLVAKYGFAVVGADGAEADDVVAVFHQTIRERHGAQAPIVIVTNDNDYVQLLDENTLIVNCNKVVLRDRFTKEMLDVFLDWKVIKGDVSDNIQPIQKKIGDKAALKLAQDRALLDRCFAENPAAKAQYELNKVLIDFNSIPSGIRTDVASKAKQWLAHVDAVVLDQPPKPTKRRQQAAKKM